LKTELINSAKISIIYYLLKSGLETILRFFTNLIVIRSLLVSEYGALNLLLSLSPYVFVLSSLGFQSLFKRYIPKLTEYFEYRKAKKLVVTGLMVSLIFSLSILCLLIIFFEQFSSFFNYKHGNVIFFIISFGIIFEVQKEMLIRAMEGFLWHTKIAKIKVGYEATRLVLVCLLFILSKNFMYYVSLEVVLWIVQSSIFYCVFRHCLINEVNTNSLSQNKKFSLNEKRNLTKYAGYTYINDFGAVLFSAPIDYFIISHFLGSTSLGLYAAALKIVVIITMWIRPANSVIEVVFYKNYEGNSETENLSQMFNFTVKSFLIILFPLIIIICSIKRPLVLLLFGDRYSDAVGLLNAILVFTALRFIRLPLQTVFKCAEKVNILFYSNIFAIYNVVMDIILVPKIGLLGAVYATGSTQLFTSLFLLFYVIKKIKIRVDVNQLVVPFVTCVLYVTMIFLLEEKMSQVMIFAIGALGFFCFIVMFVHPKLYCIFQPKELAMMKRLVKQ
jgi:O-antigen/teichoic acid export membrane protein